MVGKTPFLFPVPAVPAAWNQGFSQAGTIRTGSGRTFRFPVPTVCREPEYGNRFETGTGTSTVAGIFRGGAEC